MSDTEKPKSKVKGIKTGAVCVLLVAAFLVGRWTCTSCVFADGTLACNFPSLPKTELTE